MAEARANLPAGVADAARVGYDLGRLAASTTHQYQAYLNELPSDWAIRTLGEMATVVGGGTPSRETPSFWNGEIPWVTPGEVSREQSKFIAHTQDRITSLGLGSSGASLLPAGALLVTTRATLGARAIAAVPMATNQGFKSLVFPSAKDANFYYYLTPKFKPELVRRASGTTFLEISTLEFSRIEIPCPSHEERQAIVRVLDTLDTAIRQTEAIIAKLKQVKQGLLHDLLTRGIGANGELRSPQSHAPRLYKPSPLGWIPKDWECLPLGELAESMVDGPFGSNLKTAHYVENPGVRVVRLQNILPGEYDDSERAFISDRHAASLSRNRVVGGDALIASLGDARYPVGRSCCYPTGLPDAVNKADCFRFRSNARCGNAFVTLALNGATARRQVSGYEQGVTMKRINLGNLRRVEIALPAVMEQNLVVERVLAARRKIGAVTLEHEKLQKEKSGLMDDLLTGRVRVTPLLEAAATPWLHSERG